MEYYVNEIHKAENRPASTGFMYGDVTHEGCVYDKDAEITLQDFIGTILEYFSSSILFIYVSVIFLT
jgi:hypothetical protein